MQKRFDVRVICNHDIGVREIIPEVLFCYDKKDDDIMKIVDERTIDFNSDDYECIRIYSKGVK